MVNKINIKTEDYKNENERITILNAMHCTMIDMNNENAYDAWIYTMPDEPSEYDYIDIAEDDNMFNECIEAFNRLFNRYSKYGLYRPVETTMKLMKDNNIDIEVIK